MFVKNINIEQPLDDHSIWKYMSLDKFILLLANRKLFFPWIYYLPDENEGLIFSEEYIAKIKNILGIHDNFAANDWHRSLQKYIAISSWHLSRNTSYAMWRIYSSEGDGVAIKTNYRKIKEAIQKAPFDIYAGKVSYSTEFSDTDSMILPFFRKSAQYAYEKELRLLVDCTDMLNIPETINVDINLNDILDAVYVSPFAETCFYDAVSEITKKYDLNIKVIHDNSIRENR